MIDYESEILGTPEQRLARFQAKQKREEQKNSPEQRVLDAEVARKAQMRLDYTLAILASGGLPEINRRVASGETAAWAAANGLHDGPPSPRPPALRLRDLRPAFPIYNASSIFLKYRRDYVF